MRLVDENEKVIAFHSEDEEPYGCFSNWYKSRFFARGFDYICVEQYMMHQKALLFDDRETAAKILNTDSPAEMKALGRQVKNFNSKIWDGFKILLIYDGVLHKFITDKAIQDILLSTGDAILAEGAANDLIWGTGLNVKNTEKTPVKDWPGENNLGWILMKVRETIRCYRHLEDYYGAYVNTHD